MSFQLSIPMPKIADLDLGVPQIDSSIAWCRWEELAELRAHDGLPVLVGLPIEDTDIDQVVDRVTDDPGFRWVKKPFLIQGTECIMHDSLEPIAKQVAAMTAIVHAFGGTFVESGIYAESIMENFGVPWHFDGMGRPDKYIGLITSPLIDESQTDREACATDYAINVEAVQLYAGNPRLVGESIKAKNNQGIVDPTKLKVWKNTESFPIVFSGHQLHSRGPIDLSLTRRAVRLSGTEVSYSRSRR